MNSASLFEEKLFQKMKENLGNESFGASELAEQMNLSRSQLHRKIHQMTRNSTTHYMQEFRLERAKEMLLQTDLTVAEIGYQCGFNSATYFSSVFTHHFNITPGHFRNTGQITSTSDGKMKRRPAFMILLAGIAIVTVLLIIWFLQDQKSHRRQVFPESAPKSVVIMPLNNLNLKDDEIYICEGIRGAINSRLSAIQDLRVINASTWELRDMKTNEIESLAKATNLLAGQIQRYRDTIRVEVYLIEIKSGDQIWGQTYDRKFDDLLTLQSEIAEKITIALRLKLKV